MLIIFLLLLLFKSPFVCFSHFLLKMKTFYYYKNVWIWIHNTDASSQIVRVNLLCYRMFYILFCCLLKTKLFLVTMARQMTIRVCLRSELWNGMAMKRDEEMRNKIYYWGKPQNILVSYIASSVGDKWHDDSEVEGKGGFDQV